MLSDRLQQVTVVGAAGKMGRGIALLLLQAMARQDAELTGRVGSENYRLVLIDADDQRLATLWDYLKPALTKYAIQNMNALRGYFAKRNDLIENSDMIAAFVDGAFRMLRLSQDVSAARDSRLVFEAVAEDVSVKRQLYQSLRQFLSPDTIYCTNTSSIPISTLDAEAQLGHRLIGFHFYNPPPLQKLVELIPAEQGAPDLIQLAQELGKQLGKTLVMAKDVAGFIGNGHFMRELCYADERVKILSKDFPQEQTIYLLNSITQQFLLRPMGIFQLVDYVGIDVCQGILKVMRRHIPDEIFRCDLVDQMISLGVSGGQAPDGSQKPGFFQYVNGQPVAVFDATKVRYEQLSHATWKRLFDQELAPIPARAEPWSRLVKDSMRKEKLQQYFKELFQERTLGAQEAQHFLLRSRAIAEQLVDNRVAADGKDVNTVLELGFSHLYGPMNSFY